MELESSGFAIEEPQEITNITPEENTAKIVRLFEYLTGDDKTKAQAAYDEAKADWPGRWPGQNEPHCYAIADTLSFDGDAGMGLGEDDALVQKIRAFAISEPE
tara:strand:- start:61 stop:369 length:309 start_codon:yes stop_codon:yes gene_type:complete